MPIEKIIVLALWLAGSFLFIRAAWYGIALIWRGYKEKRLDGWNTGLLIPVVILGTIRGIHSLLIFWRDIFGVN